MFEAGDFGVEVVDLVAEVMEAAAFGEELGDGGIFGGGLDEFQGGGGAGQAEKDDPGALNGVVEDFRDRGGGEGGAEAFEARFDGIDDEADVMERAGTGGRVRHWWRHAGE